MIISKITITSISDKMTITIIIVVVMIISKMKKKINEEKNYRYNHPLGT